MYLSSRDDILGMEKQMLAALTYDLTVPTCYLFNARFRKAAGVQDDLKVSGAQHRWAKQVQHSMRAQDGCACTCAPSQPQPSNPCSK
jgi:hypothetical protein